MFHTPSIYHLCPEGERERERESAGTYIMATTKMKKEQKFYDFTSIKIDHLQVCINPEPGQEDLL